MSSPSPLFTSLCSSLNLDDTTRSTALQLFDNFNKSDLVAVNHRQDETAVKCAMRCAVLAASRVAVTTTLDGQEVCGNAVSLSQVLRDEVDASSFILHLKKFLERVPLPASIHHDLTEIKSSFTFSHTFYKKFEEIWDRLVPTSDSVPAKQCAWLLFIVCKVDILKKKTEIVENALLLIGTLHFVLSRLPLGSGNGEELLQTLSELLKTSCKYSQPYVEKVLDEVRMLAAGRFITVGSDGERFTDVFARGVGEVVRALSEYYQHFLTHEDIDERDFVLTGKLKVATPRKQRVQMTPFAKQVDSSQKLISQRLLRWDANSDSSSVSMSSKMQEVKQHPQTPVRTPVPTMTPMTQAMEMNNWLTSLTEDAEVSDTLLSFCRRCDPDPESDISVLVARLLYSIEALLDRKGIGTRCEKPISAGSEGLRALSANNPKSAVILKLYFQLLEMMLQNESRKNASANLSTILHNSTFHKSLLASCFESLLFLHNICAVAFEEVLSACEISGFDFWKIITTYCNVDPRMPIPLKMHFRVIEIRIITTLGWVSESPVHSAVRALSQQPKHSIAEVSKEDEDHTPSSSPKPQPIHVTFDLFFRRVLSFTAYRVLTITEELALPQALQEEIWAAMKFFLSDKTELLTNRHLDQVVLCAVFGVAKARNHQLKFAKLIELYATLNPDEALRVTRQVHLPQGEGSIIDLYNAVMVPHVREFTGGHRRSESARILSFSPDSSLRSTISPQFLHLADKRAQSPSLGKSPYRSPYMTPMTQRLFAVQESPTVSRSSDKLIDFDNEARKYEPEK